MRKDFGVIGALAIIASSWPQFAESVEPTQITAKQAAAEFGLTDTDLTQMPSEVYDCIRQYAQSGSRYNKPQDHQDEIVEIERQLAAMQRQASKKFAAMGFLLFQPRYVYLRDTSGMYAGYKLTAPSVSLSVATKKSISKEDTVFSEHDGPLHSPGEFDRMFLSRQQDGLVYLHEEMCTWPEGTKTPSLYDEQFAAEVLEGSWSGYLKGDIIVLRLAAEASAKRKEAQSGFELKTRGGTEADLASSYEQPLRDLGEFNDKESTKFRVLWSGVHAGDLLLYMKRDAMLAIEGSSYGFITSVEAE